MPLETRTYRRSELYEQVWARPMREVAKDYGVSDVALAKTCRKLAVPVPGVGYWARKRAGRRTHRAALPPLPGGATEEITVNVWRPDEASSALRPETKAIAVALRDPAAAIVVADQLTDPCQLVVETARCFSGKSSSNGKANRQLAMWVSSESRDRALRIFDALIKALDQRGVRVEVADPDGRDSQGNRLPCAIWKAASVSHVRIMDQWVMFKMTENARGGLEFKIVDPNYHPGRSWWKDGKRLRLEHQLNSFIAGLYEKADVIKRANEGYERARREREAESKRLLEAQRRAEAEQRQATKFEGMITRWRLAHDIRAFSQEAHEMLAAAQCSIRRGGWVDELLTWGMAYADRIDPLTPLAEEIAAYQAKQQEKSHSAPPAGEPPVSK